MNELRKKIILGAPDAITASYCSKFGADYVWASSFIMSALLGKKDEGIVNFNSFLPLIESIVTGSNVPVILDFDIGGRNPSEYKKNLNLIKRVGLGGICMEDEDWPKFNAMLNIKSRKLISSDKMAEKINIARSCLGEEFLIVARTHSFITGEEIFLIQDRINKYVNAGADIICIHNANSSWKKYSTTLESLSINNPLLIIVSRKNSLPEFICNNSKVEYILYPNQLYRTMLFPIIKRNCISSLINANKIKVDIIFNAINKINEK
ncbi:MAG: hypothetical protein UV40_C0029G0006 [Parcubacteria group bacterium GW2011_GWA1_42_7]|nr:MAG: hypothetical protein UV34_C0027G0007 [Parcubacteria group bacterium GW2011_GWB1_42_6]KKS69246.1 MAG: hypothetical protein UV40_C0029G0006 [Parcubacteria group bacterium GW2011_GWA1_42_7]